MSILILVDEEEKNVVSTVLITHTNKQYTSTKAN